MPRLHKFILKKPAWPIAVYEGTKQLVCEEDYVQTADVFWVATKQPDTITLKPLRFDTSKPMTEEVRKAVDPDHRERYARESGDVP